MEQNVHKTLRARVSTIKRVLTHVTLVESAVLSLACRQRSHQRERPPDVGLAAVHIRKHSEERLG